VLRFRDQSWLEALDASGQKIERDLVDAGSERHFSAGQVAHITLGNAQAVDISQGGRPLDLAPFLDGNVARFSVSREGNITPPGE